MILSKYGIELRSLGQKDLELVREKRNSEAVRNKMLYRDIITKEQQKQWYNKLNPISDFYFLIETDGNSYGLINVKDIDHKSGSSESGLFIWDERALQSHIPVLASWLLSEAGYGIMGGHNTQIRVLKENKAAIEFNIKMGFTIKKEEGDVVFMHQSRKSFSEATRESRNRIIRGLKTGHEINLTFNDHENDELYLERFLFLTDKKRHLRRKINDRHYTFKITF